MLCVWNRLFLASRHFCDSFSGPSTALYKGRKRLSWLEHAHGEDQRSVGRAQVWGRNSAGLWPPPLYTLCPLPWDLYLGTRLVLDLSRWTKSLLLSVARSLASEVLQTASATCLPTALTSSLCPFSVGLLCSQELASFKCVLTHRVHKSDLLVPLSPRLYYHPSSCSWARQR